MKAETLQVAQIISDSENKLSQMFENSGIKLGFLNFNQKSGTISIENLDI